MHILLRGSAAQRLRLASGLILFAFALTHFLNHALGLVSIDAMSLAQEWRMAFTRSLPGTVILGLAIFIHIGFALAKLMSRSTLRMPAWEMAQLLLGLAIPFLLFPHIVHTRFAQTLFGVNDVYFYELLQLWPGNAWQQSALLLIVWAHGCIGLHFWLRLTRWYKKWFASLLALAVLIPALSIAGFAVAGRAATDAVADPDILAAVRSVLNWPEAANMSRLVLYDRWSSYGFYAVLALVLASMAARWMLIARRKKVTIAYDPEPTIMAAGGPTLLEISRMNAIPHLSVCGGRARCSTCRVEVLEGNEHLPQPTGAEAATLASIGAGPNVRLACQLRPSKPILVNVLLRPGGRVRRNEDGQGIERDLAVLFLDVRGFTNMSQDKLPYDVVFILNRLFAAVGQAIQEENGWIDKYLGDGLMAVFGRDTDAADGCRRAIRAAGRIDAALDKVNQDLSSELNEPLRIGMGLHVGPLVLGEIGHDKTAAMTVIGRTVNAASRLESATKDMDCQFVISTDAAEHAGLDLAAHQTHSVRVRGLSQPLQVIAIAAARELQ